MYGFFCGIRRPASRHLPGAVSHILAGHWAWVVSISGLRPLLDGVLGSIWAGFRVIYGRTNDLIHEPNIAAIGPLASNCALTHLFGMFAKKRPYPPTTLFLLIDTGLGPLPRYQSGYLDGPFRDLHSALPSSLSGSTM